MCDEMAFYLHGDGFGKVQKLDGIVISIAAD